MLKHCREIGVEAKPPVEAASKGGRGRGGDERGGGIRDRLGMLRVRKGGFGGGQMGPLLQKGVPERLLRRVPPGKGPRINIHLH